MKNEPSKQDVQPGNGKPPVSMPEARVEKASRFSPIWLVPLGAAVIALYLAVNAFVTRGQLITLTFKTADGLTAHQTEVRHKAVKLGTVQEISLAEDMSTVVVHVRINAAAKAMLTDHATFWVVRPRLSGADLARLESGLETLVSGAYVAVDPGPQGGIPTREFVGLEEPPSVRSDEPGHVFKLKSTRLGSLGVGAPIFYHEVQVGELLNYDAGNGTGPVSMRIFVRAPFDALVQQNTHFWNVSGLSLDMGPAGLHLELQSIQSLLSGGIAFENRDTRKPIAPADANQVFELYSNEASAEADIFERVPCVTYLETSLSGLAVGAPVQIRGVQMGIVTDERLVVDARGRVLARVGFDIQPERALHDLGGRSPQDLTTYLVTQGLHVEVASTNFVTGQKALALEYGVDGKSTPPVMEGQALLLTGQAGGLDNVTRSMGDVAAKLNQIPFDEIGKNIDKTLRSLSETVNGPKLQNTLQELTATLAEVRQLAHNADAGLAPVLARLPQMASQMQEAAQEVKDTVGQAGYGKDSDFQRSMTRLIGQTEEAARNIRRFVDYIDRHPEALIRGRSEGAN
jgi:paraquat-inducible protein B